MAQNGRTSQRLGMLEAPVRFACVRDNDPNRSQENRQMLPHHELSLSPKDGYAVLRNCQIYPTDATPRWLIDCPKTYRLKCLVFSDTSSTNERHNRFRSRTSGTWMKRPAAWHMVGSTTVNAKGKKIVWIKTTGHEKSNFKLVLAQMADSTKLKLMMIFKRKTMLKETIPAGILLLVDLKTAWVWNTRPRAAFKDRSLLVLDRFAPHLTPSVKDRFHDENIAYVSTKFSNNIWRSCGLNESRQENTRQASLSPNYYICLQMDFVSMEESEPKNCCQVC